MLEASQLEQTTDATSTEVEMNWDAVAEVDLDKDFNERVRPPDAGDYTVAWQIGDKGIKPEKTGTSFGVNLSGSIVAPDEPHHEYPISNTYVSSYIPRMKGISGLHFLLNKLGAEVSPRMSLLELKRVAEETFSQKPHGIARLEWRASVQEGGSWKQVAQRMNQFPNETDEEGHPTGRKQHWIDYKTADGETVQAYAQVYVVAHFPS